MFIIDADEGSYSEFTLSSFWTSRSAKLTADMAPSLQVELRFTILLIKITYHALEMRIQYAMLCCHVAAPPLVHFKDNLQEMSNPPGWSIFRPKNAPKDAYTLTTATDVSTH
eukprot:5786364-Pleurochrysis_carterae.AAC.1